MTIAELRRYIQDSEFFYDRDREIKFEFSGMYLCIRRSTVPEKGPVVFDMVVDKEEK